MQETSYHLVARRAEQLNQAVTAVQYYLRAGSVEEALRVVSQRIFEWESRSDWPLVRQVLEEFDKDDLPHSLREYFGLALIETGEVIQGEIILTESLAHQTKSFRPYFGLALLAYRAGDAPRALDLVERGLVYTRSLRGRAQLLRTRMAALVHLGHLDEALRDAESIVTVAQDLGDASLLIQCLGAQGWVLTKLGREERAITVAKHAIDIALKQELLHKALPAVNTYVSYSYRLGHIQEELCLIHALQRVKSQSPLAEPWADFHLGRYHMQTQHDFHAALRAYERATRTFESKFTDLPTAFQSLSEEIYCKLRVGDFSTPKRDLSHLKRLAANSAMQDDTAIYTLTQGFAAYFQSRFDAAFKELTCGIEMFRTTNPELDLIRAVAYLADIERYRGDLGLERIEQLVDLLDRLESDWPLALEQEVLSDLYAECVNREWFAERFIEYLPDDHPAKCFHAARSPSLTLRTLGAFEARLNNAKLRVSGKACELLVYLALHREVKRERLVDALWPEKDLEAGRRNLKSLVYRIRSTVHRAVRWNLKYIIEFDGNGFYRIGHGINVDLDLDAIDDAKRIGNKKACLDAVELYQGSFLKGHVEPTQWIAETRAYYQRTAAELCVQLARAAWQESTLKVAYGFYQRALEFDPTCSEASAELSELTALMGGFHSLRVPVTFPDEARESDVVSAPREP